MALGRSNQMTLLRSNHSSCHLRWNRSSRHSPVGGIERRGAGCGAGCAISPPPAPGGKSATCASSMAAVAAASAAGTAGRNGSPAAGIRGSRGCQPAA
eukprot:3357294-Heterocapsa_arctica.AAC.1